MLLFLLTTLARAGERQVLRGHVPAVIARLSPVGSLPGTNRLNLAIGLPLRNREALTNLLRQIYDPASPDYRHYLTPEQFTAQFGPTEKDYQAVIAFARANGLMVTGTHPNRLLVDASGSVVDIERSLHVTLRVYQHPTEKRMFHAPDAEPSLDLAVPISSISGLDDYSLPRPRLQAAPAPKILPNTGSGSGGAYMGKDFRAAYVPDSSLDGSGQTVGLLQFDGYTASDITYYESQAGLPNITLSNVLIDGASGHPSGGGGEVEVSLDIEMAISMATNLSRVIVYMAPNPSPWEDLLNRMANDNLAKQLSCSWYQSGGAAKPTTDSIFQQMAAQGQSFFNASGDYDAYTGLIDFPGDTPYLTQVGGTTLTTTGPGGAWSSETVWNRGNGIGSGGGISTQYPIPSWQTNINMTVNQGSTTKRNVPDVALTAENVYVRADGGNHTVGGTSCAAPLWAGFCALINQQAAASGRSPVGLINQAVDTIGSGVSYTTAFHDITTGNNTSPGSPAKFYAVAGYDLCTGWGTPAGQNLINALANPEPLLITPASGFSSIGGVGGPFTVTSQSLSLTNSGTNTLTWSLVNTSLWLNASPGGGTLSPHGPAAVVTVSLNSTASNLTVGAYSATVWFTNLTSGVGQSRQYSLSVISPPTITTQPTNQAVLDGSTAAFTVAATGGLPLYYQWKVNGTNLIEGGNISGSTTTSLTINNVSTANVGTYSVTVSNIANVATSSNALLSITPSLPVILTQPASQAVGIEGTAQFSVFAVGSKPLHYQWKFSGTNIVDATNTTLVLNNLQFDQAGNYTVLVTNILGFVTSSNAVLTVIPCDPVPAELVGWWQAEGNANDSIGTNNGTLSSSGVTFVNGKVGQGFRLDGTNSFVQIPDSPVLKPANITVEAWVWLDPNISTNIYEWIVFTKNTRSYFFEGYSLLKQRLSNGDGTYTDRFSFVVSSSSGNQVVTYSTTAVQRGVWYHVAGTYDSNNLKLYVNGVAEATAIAGFPLDYGTRPVFIGTTGEADPYNGKLSGIIDEVSIYNRALSTNEIQAIYNAGSGGKCPPAPVPPTITAQPANQVLSVGGTASFGVIANGTAPLSYQWTFSETNLIGATNATLILNNVQTNQAGLYAVLVTNNYGSILSSNAVLTINTQSSYLFFDDFNGPALNPIWQASLPNANLAFLISGSPHSATYLGAPNYSFQTLGGYSVLHMTNNMNNFQRVGWGSSATFNPSAFTYEVRFNTLIQSNTTSVDTFIEIWILDPTNPNRYDIVAPFGNGYSLDRQFAVGSSIDNTYGSQPFNYQNNTWYRLVIQDLPGQNIRVSLRNDSGTELIGQTLNHAESAYSSGFRIALSQAMGFPQGTYPSDVAVDYVSLMGDGPPTNSPAITAQPTNQTVAVGGAAGFNVTASGTPPLSYQWTFSGTNLIGATNTTLILNNVQLNQAGNYAVLVTNNYGSILSSNALLTVNPVSSYLFFDDFNGPALNPIWQASLPNANLAYPVSGGPQSATYLGAPNYSFQTLGGFSVLHMTNNLNNFQRVGWGSSVTFNPTNFTYEARFNTLVQSPSNSIDAFLEIWILDPANPNHYDIVAMFGNAYGLDKQFAVGSSIDNTYGSQPFSYQNNTWYHLVIQALPGQNLRMSLRNDSGTELIGQTLNHTKGAYSSGFRIALSQAMGKPQATYPSDVAVDYVSLMGDGPPTNSPTITTQPTNQTVAVGGTASFSVTANGTAPLSYFWQRNGVLIPGANATNYTLNNVQLSDSGSQFSCLVTNVAGSIISSNALLKVVAAVANDQCSGAIAISVPAYTNIQSTVGASSAGDPVPDCIPGFGNGVWYKFTPPSGGSIIVDTFGSDFDTGLAVYTGSCGLMTEVACNDDTGGLTSQIVLPITSGMTYYILVGGYNSYVGNLVFHLKLLTPPVIVSQPTNQMVVMGGTASFSVTANGTLPLSYQWLHSGTNLVGATNTTLALNNVQTNQAGLYAVLVTNNYGAVLSSNALLTVNAPSPLTNVPVIIGFSPKSGFVGASVIISGTNFSPVVSNNIVYFGAVRASVMGASVTNLVVTVPVGATYAPITETVNGLTAYAGQPFMPTFPGSGTLEVSSLSGPTNLTAGASPFAVAVGDLDGDGKPDVVVANVSATIWVYRNISTNGSLTAGSFASPVVLTCAAGVNGVQGLALADLEGDGRQDIIVPNYNLNTVSIFQNLSLPGSITTNSFGVRVDLAVGAQPMAVVVRDLDGDGHPEIISANFNGNTVSVLRNLGAGSGITTNSFASAVNFVTASGPSWVAVGDLDGDGKPDLATANHSSSSSLVSVLRNVSTAGNINFAGRVDLPGNVSQEETVAIGDLDGDGKPDLVVGAASGQTVSVYRNLSIPGSIATNSFAPTVDFAAGGNIHRGGLVIGDLDGDGKPDVVFATELPSHLSVFKNNSTPGNFTNSSFAPRIDFTSGLNACGVLMGDLDGDGRPDIGLANANNNTISLYHNIVSFGTPPAIISQPKNQWVPLGCDVTFNVAVRGTPAPRCQWWKGTQVLNGKTNLSLTLTNIQPSDFGSYSVVVTNVYGSVTSSPAQLSQGSSPVAHADTIYRFASGGVRVNANDLLGNDTDPDGNYLTIIAVSPNSAGGGTVGLTNNWVYYAPPAGPTNSDTFTYVVSDGYCVTDTGTVTVQIKADNPQPLTFAIANPGIGSVQLAFNGIPGNTYQIEYTDSLTNPNWQTITTQKVDAFGVCQFVDGSLTNVQTRFYRAVWP